MHPLTWSHEPLALDRAVENFDQIRAILQAPGGKVKELLRLLEECKDGKADVVMAMPNWPTFLITALEGGLAGQLNINERIQLSTFLFREGMSTRSIGQVLHASHTTVLRDKGEAAEGNQREQVVGSDGKVYPAARRAVPKPKKPRRPLPETAFMVVFDLGKVARRVEKVLADDRFDTNVDNMSTHRGELITVRDLLDEFLEKLSSPRETGESNG